VRPSPALSVIICTHSPRADYLARTLVGLRQQIASASEWELIVVDNAPRVPLDPATATTGHPDARVICEPEVGLTAARLRGIEEARAEVLVFVDDDNILAPDYLARVLALSQGWSMLGVWGCGHYSPEWEIPPPAAFSEYIRYLAVHRAPRDRWSNQPFDYAATPAGAGLCVRAPVARRYAHHVRTDPRRKLLGRTGGHLAGCEDFDLALTATDLGFGTGVFTALAMTHLMPRHRIEEPYLLRLVEGHACSTVILMALRDQKLPPPHRHLLARVREWRLRRSLAPVNLKIHDARRRGERTAWSLLAAAPAPRVAPSP
jgi:glycosyltransferase involved in cell wall biosynthesis